MQTQFNDYSNHSGLEITRAIGHLRYLPIRGIGKITDLVAKMLPTPDPSEPCIVKVRHGFEIIVNPALGKGVERTLFYYGTYEEGTLLIMSDILKEGDTFIDIGANIGLMSLHAAKIVGENGKVIAFEPLSGAYDLLIKNIALNNFENIDAVNMAVGSTDGVVEIFDNSEINRGCSSLIKTNDTGVSHTISINRLDDYLDNQGTSRVNCIKIDVEGWELEVLKGAANILSSPDAPMCIVEYSALHPSQGGDTQDVYTFLSNINSYQIFRLARGKGRPSKLLEIEGIGDLPRHDNLFCFLPEHVKKMPKRLFI